MSRSTLSRMNGLTFALADSAADRRPTRATNDAAERPPASFTRGVGFCPPGKGSTTPVSLRRRGSPLAAGIPPPPTWYDCCLTTCRPTAAAAPRPGLKDPLARSVFSRDEDGHDSAILAPPCRGLHPADRGGGCRPTIRPARAGHAPALAGPGQPHDDQPGRAAQFRSSSGALRSIRQIELNVTGAMEIARLSPRQRNHLAFAGAAEVPQRSTSHQPRRARDNNLLGRHRQNSGSS